jgi:hypothetical protein
MRAVFSIVGLLIVVAVIGLLAKKQMQSVPAASPMPGASQGTAAGPVTPKQQIDQMKQGLEATLQQPREMPDEKK